jgi:extradiol dioxygenase family protein
MPDLRPFHFAFPVHDIAAARHFYGDVLGGSISISSGTRSSRIWMPPNGLLA